MEEIVTGEAVVLDLPSARFPSRILAFLIDALVQGAAMMIILIGAFVGFASDNVDQAAVAAVLITAFVLVIVGYPVVFESLSRGRTLGKLALGLRVVADDGGPERFRQALIRGLAGFVECWSLFGAPALITSMLSARDKRLGDIFAGTFVIRERAPRLAAAPYQVPVHQAAAYSGGPHGAGSPPHQAVTPIDPRLRSWSATLDLSALPDPIAASAASYLSRYWQLNPDARDHLGQRLAADIAARVSPPPPPGLPPATYLHTVLAERRNRAMARLTPDTSTAATAPVWSSSPEPAASGAPFPESRPPESRPPESRPPEPLSPRPAVPEGTAFTPPE